MKIFYIIVGLLLMASIVLAISPGDIYSQSQVDGVDPYSVGLGCGYSGWNLYFQDNNLKAIQYNFYCNNIEPYNNSHYIVMNDTFIFNYPVHRILNCINEYGSYKECKKNKMIPDLRRGVQRYKMYIRKNIESYQTPLDVSQYNFTVSLGDL